MRSFKKIVLAIGLTATCMPVAGIAQAPAEASAQTAAVPPDQQATKEQLNKLFEAMRLREQFDNMTKMMPQIVQQQFRAEMKQVLANTPRAQQLTPDQQAALDKLMDKYTEKARSIYPIGEILDDAATVYQRHMSRTDVDAYIAFYSSPAGQHLLDVQPVIMKEYMPMAIERVQTRTKALSAEMAQDVQNLMEAQAPAKGAPSTGQPATK